MKEGIEDTIKGIRILRGHIDNAPYNKKFSLMTSELYKFQIDMEKKLHKFIPQISKLSKDKMLESVNEAYGDLNDAGFKKVEIYNKIVVKIIVKIST